MILFRVATMASLALSTSVAFAQANPSATGAATASQHAPSSKKELRSKNHALEKAVRRSMSMAKGLNPSNINIVALSGNVTLEGSVPEEAEMDLAVGAATSTPGVSHVTNGLTIREPGH